VCTAGDTAHIDTIFKFLPHTRVNMGASIFFTAAVIRAFRSSSSHDNGGTNTLHEMHVAQYRVFLGGKVRPGRAADHSPPPSAAVMEEWRYTCTHPVGHT
jgi:hypothetical protein